MRVQKRDRQVNLIPVIAACIAVVGQAVILGNDFGSGSDLQGNGSARMITAAAVSRAGAIEIPSPPPRG